MDVTHLIYFHGKDDGVDAVEFEVDCKISYRLSGGQKGVYHLAPESCCPEYPPDCEIELESATIGYGNMEYPLTKESRWWGIIEAELNLDEQVVEECFDDDEILSELYF